MIQKLKKKENLRITFMLVRLISYSHENAGMLEIRDLQEAEKVMGKAVEDKNKKELEIIKRNLSEGSIGDAHVNKREETSKKFSVKQKKERRTNRLQRKPNNHMDISNQTYF